MNVFADSIIKQSVNVVKVALSASNLPSFPATLRRLLLLLLFSSSFLLLTALNQRHKVLHLASFGHVCAIEDWVLFIVVKVCKKLCDCNLESIQCLFLDLFKPVLVDHVLPVVRPILHRICTIVEHTMPVHIVVHANFLILSSMWEPEVTSLSPIDMILFVEDFLVFLRVGIDVFLQLQELFFVNGEHRKLIAHLRIGHILLSELNGTNSHTTNGL